SADPPQVAIASEALVRRYFPGRDPIGGVVHIGSTAVQIVGVARDGKYQLITESPRPFLYVPAPQWYRADAVLIVRTAGNATPIARRLPDVVRALDAGVPLFDMRSVAQHLEIATFMQRMIATLLGAFGALALVLATVGLYAVIAATAAQRTAEIGMRIALGAAPRDIVSLILKQGLGMTGAGIAVGLAASFAVTRLFKSLLIGVSTTDVASFGGTTLLLVSVAILAAYLPARRAAAIDPLQALRTE